MIAPRTRRHVSIASLLACAMTMPGLGGMLSAAPTPAAQAAITARQAGYKKMGQAMKALNDQLKADAPDKAVLVASARVVAITAREQGRYFPAGSGPQPGVQTDALANIWTERPAFDAAMVKLVSESTKLFQTANGGDVAAIRAQAKATGATCGACHRQFRADN